MLLGVVVTRDGELLRGLREWRSVGGGMPGPFARWPPETAPASLIRLPAGIEPAADLIADVEHALSA